MAESMNGQLKVELGLDGTFSHAAAARSGCEEAIRLYNDERSHGSLENLTPSQAYDLTGEQDKRWGKAGAIDRSTRSRTALDAVNLLQVETNNVNCQPVDDF
jgi:transposase InsO family protein